MTGISRFVWVVSAWPDRISFELQKHEPDFVIFAPLILHPVFFAKENATAAYEEQFNYWDTILEKIIPQWPKPDFVVLSSEPTKVEHFTDLRNQLIDRWNKEMNSKILNNKMKNVDFMEVNPSLPKLKMPKMLNT